MNLYKTIFQASMCKIYCFFKCISMTLIPFLFTFLVAVKMPNTDLKPPCSQSPFLITSLKAWIISGYWDALFLPVDKLNGRLLLQLLDSQFKESDRCLVRRSVSLFRSHTAPSPGEQHTAVTTPNTIPSELMHVLNTRLMCHAVVRM